MRLLLFDVLSYLKNPKEEEEEVEDDEMEKSRKILWNHIGGISRDVRFYVVLKVVHTKTTNNFRRLREWTKRVTSMSHHINSIRFSRFKKIIFSFIWQMNGWNYSFAEFFRNEKWWWIQKFSEISFSHRHLASSHLLV